MSALEREAGKGMVGAGDTRRRRARKARDRLRPFLPYRSSCFAIRMHCALRPRRGSMPRRNGDGGYSHGNENSGLLAMAV